MKQTSLFLAAAPLFFTFEAGAQTPSPVTYTASVKRAALSLSDELPAPDPVLKSSVALQSFEGRVDNNKTLFQWHVMQNEAGDRFEVEKSYDGKNFSMAALIFTSEKEGAEQYQFKHAMSKKPAKYYRLKIINKNNTVTSSGVIFLR